ncbi:MAG: pyridoxal phosphate-dependent aminotransferase [Christensenella sp.]|jgi:cystathionine beta-lyase|nr:pyridoxal phosphate-dependent aminotransferase [Christensenella sp.]
MYDFDKMTDRKGTSCSKWDNMSSMFTEKGLLPLWIADMDFRCCEEAIEAMRQRVDHGIFGYTVLPDSYFESIAGWMQRRHNWTVRKEWLVTSVTVVSALNIFVQAFTKPGDGVIIQKPVYFPFEECIQDNDRRLVNNELIEKEGYYTIDFEDLEEKAARPENKMLLLCSPHNPVCRAWTEEELRRVIDICSRNDIYLIADEIHMDFVFKAEHVPVGTLTNYSKLAVCTSPSKTFNMAGLKMANIFIPDEAMRKEFTRRSKSQCGIIPNNPVSITGISAAYAKGDKWLDEVKQYIWENFQFVDAYLKEYMPKLKMTKPEATYLAWIDFSGVGLSGLKLRSFLRGKARVALDEGMVFGKSGENFARINVATDRTVVRECLDRIRDNLAR